MAETECTSNVYLQGSSTGSNKSEKNVRHRDLQVRCIYAPSLCKNLYNND